MPFDDAKYHRERRRAAAKKGLCSVAHYKLVEG